MAAKMQQLGRQMLPAGEDAVYGSYTQAFMDHIRAAFPGMNLIDAQVVYYDGWIAWHLRMFDAGYKPDSQIEFIYEPILVSMQGYGEFRRQLAAHQIRRIRQHPAAWSAFLKRVDDGQRLLPIEREAAELAAFIRETLQPSIERTRFDASQVERHMAMAHRVPADVANLIGQFATTGITPQTPVPMRLQVKHKLELLTRRVASLTPAQVAAEMRLILADVEKSLPEDEHTLKKARK